MGKKLLLYHTDNDGFGAAFSFYWFGNMANNLDYYEYEYGHKLPDFIEEYQELIFVDVICDLDELDELIVSGVQVTILDHHVSLFEKVHDHYVGWYTYPNFEYIFDENKSGAVIAFQYLCPDSPIPTLLQYVQDRDLWAWGLEDSKEVNAGLDSIEKGFHSWFAHLYDVSHLIDRGDAVVAHVDNTVKMIAEQAIALPGNVCVCNCTSHWSEVGNYLNERGYRLAFLYYDTARGGRKWSIRGRGAREAAEYYDGGGHALAAGFITETAVDDPVEVVEVVIEDLIEREILSS